MPIFVILLFEHSVWNNKYNIKGKVILSYYYFESLDKWYPKDKWNYYEIETYKFCEKNIGTHKQKSIELLITNYEQEGKLF